MAEPATKRTPWLDDFVEDPETAVDELLRGVADIAPYERAEPVDVLLLFFGGLEEEDPQRQALDGAVSTWLLARREDGPNVRRRYGMNRYIDELVQALMAVHRLPLPETAAMLRRELPSFDAWLGSLYSGPGRDPGGELWRAMARTQPNHSLTEEWFRSCEEAGHTLPEHYVDIGLLGLQHLPEPDGQPRGDLGPEVLAGLFRWANRLEPPGPASRRAFQRRLATLMVVYPRGPEQWRKLVSPLLRLYPPSAPFRDWLEGAGLKLGEIDPKKDPLPPLPPKSRLDDLLRRLETETISRLLPEIWSLVRDYERYGEATGEVEFVVKTALNFSGRLRRSAPLQALRLARIAHHWAPYDPYSWTQWAAALEVLGKADEAEVVYLEAMRRFPEGEVARGALADLLAKTGRTDEAEALLRETMRRFKEDEFSRTALADLLAKTGRTKEAESLFRELVDKSPRNEYPRNALANLLANSGRTKQAEALLRETIDLLPHRAVAIHSLAFWLLRWDRVSEAEELYRQIRSRFPENTYTRKLAKEIARRQEGLQGEIEMPDFSEPRLDSRQSAPASHATSSDTQTDTRSQGQEARAEAPSVAAERDIEGVAHKPISEEEAEFPLEQQRVADQEKPSVPAERVAEEEIPRVAREKGDEDEAESVQSLASHPPPESADDFEIHPRLKRNAAVGRADLILRAGQNGTVRQRALEEIGQVLTADPEHIYPQLVLSLHEAARRQELPEQVEAFPHAYPLRFLAAQETGAAEDWNRLLADFEDHRPVTLLGRVMSSNGNADPDDVRDLAVWVDSSNDSRRGFEAFVADRLGLWLGEAPRETDPVELLGRLRAHRDEAETLVGDALRRSADESVSQYA